MSDWQKYRDELNQYILSQQSGMMLDADQEWNARYDPDSFGKAAFKLQNGSIVKRFITIWELFDDRLMFQNCLERLAEKALLIYEKTQFSTIVTATLTGKELAAHVFERIRRKIPKSQIDLVHFGDYPTGAFSLNNTHNFKNKHALILTDVVSSGKLINAIAEVVTKHQGRVDAVLAAIITNPDLIDNQNLEDGQIYTFSTGKRALLHNLSDFKIEPTDDYDESKVIPIDFHSVLPERKNLNKAVYIPLFDVSQTFAHLEQAEAIDYGFYEFDNSRFTCAFIFPRLLEKFKDEIWDKISEPIITAAQEERAINNDLLLVTTFQRKDSMLKNFIEDRLIEKGFNPESVITLKRGLADSPYLNLTLGIKKSQAKGKTVILTLAALSTHEKLRNIVSLLVQEQVKKIIVVCLLNRMGPYSMNFVKSIERFTKRIKVESDDQNKDEEFTQFDFYSIYSFCDLKNNYVGNISNEVSWLFSKFRRHTKVEAFDRLCDRMENYFALNNYAARAFTDENPSEPREPYQLTLATEDASSPVRIKTVTQEAKIALITYNLSIKRDFDPIFEEIISTDERRIFIHLFGLLLSDIDYLRFTGALLNLKVKILKRIESLRQERFNLETVADKFLSDKDLMRIKSIVNAEVYLIFGLAIIAHHSSLEDWKDFETMIDTLLFCGKTTDEWIQKYPASLIEFFSDERIFFVLSLLLHGVFPSFHRQKNSILEKIKNKFDEDIEDCKQKFKSAFGEDSEINLSKLQNSSQVKENLKSVPLLIINNFDLLLTETGKHDHLEKHQYIRYLHREVLRPREGHSPIFTSMQTLIKILEDFLEDFEKNNDLKEEITENILTKVDAALNGTSSLDMISKAIRQMFFFTPTTFEQQSRFTNIVGQDGFANDADELKRKLSEIRNDKKCSIEDKKILTEITGRMRDDFLEGDSKLRSILRDYVVGLDEILEQMTQESNEYLNKQGFNDLLNGCIEQIKQSKVTADQSGKYVYPVLCDKRLLRETIRNLYHNIEHSFRDVGVVDRQHLSRELVSVELGKTEYIPKPEKHKKLGVFFRLKVGAGHAPDFEDFHAAENTITDQLLKIQDYGGEWNLDSNEAGGFTFELKLLSRFGFFDGSSKEDIKLEVTADEKN